MEREKNELSQLLALEKKDSLELRQSLIEQNKKKNEFLSEELKVYQDQVEKINFFQKWPKISFLF